MTGKSEVLPMMILTIGFMFLLLCLFLSYSIYSFYSDYNFCSVYPLSYSSRMDSEAQKKPIQKPPTT